MSHNSEFDDVAYNISGDVSPSTQTSESDPDPNHGHQGQQAYMQPVYDQHGQRAYEQPGFDQHRQQEHVYGYDQDEDGLSDNVRRVAVRQTTPNVVVNSSKPPDYIIISSITAVCCCIPFGLLAFIFALKAKTAVREGDMEKAKRYANYALTWICFTVVAVILYTIGGIVYIVKSEAGKGH